MRYGPPTHAELAAATEPLNEYQHKRSIADNAIQSVSWRWELPAAAVMSNRPVTQLNPARILSNECGAGRHSILVLRLIRIDPTATEW
jgi:hypothetical protein